MVCGHAGFPFGKFCSLFNMPLFFMVSGYFFKENYYMNIESVKVFIKKRFKYLYYPFIICNIIFLLLHNFFLDINFYTNNPLLEKANVGFSMGLQQEYSLFQTLQKLFYTVILASIQQLAGPTWFLKVLFFISIIFCIGSFVISKIIKNKKNFEITRATLCLLCLVCGYFLYLNNFHFYHIGLIFSYIILFYIGFLYKKYNEKRKINSILFFFCTFILIYYTKNYPAFSISANKYNTPFGLIVMSICGFVFILYISQFIERNLPKISKCISYTGEHSLIILCLHCLFFKLINYLQISIYNLPDYTLAAIHIFSFNGWWIAYTVVGIAGSLVALEVYNKTKLKLANILSNNKKLS